MKVDAELTSTRFWNRVMKTFFFFRGARCGQLDIEKQHLDFFLGTPAQKRATTLRI